MKRILVVLIAAISFMTQGLWAHTIYIKKNPTNESGIEFGVDNASGFVKWRAYVKGQSNNSQGLNTGWTLANGWWYYDLSSVSSRVMWRVTGLENQKFTITYWVFKSDGTWDYGPQVEVISDTILPSANFTNLTSNTVYKQATFNISVSSSDNLSGVDAIRIYVVVPSGYSMSGWTASGVTNQYYLEFFGSSVNYNFTAPGSGLYTFTLWVKDKAGNIAYEPGGPVTVGVDLSAPIKYSCDTTNYTCSQSASGSYSSLSDCQTNCVAPVVKYTCNTANYTCSQSSAGSYSSLTSCQSACTAPPVEDFHYADHFIYPLKCSKIYRTDPDSQVPTGACFDYQPFGSLFAYSDKIHLGADLNLKGVNDFGAPEYAIANALIYDFGWTSGWGNYLILQITAKPGQPFILPNGQTASQIYVLYGHLNEIKVIKDDGTVIEQSKLVKKSTYVKIGWQVGTVGDGNGNYSPHLHFEIRINGYAQLGPGYWPVNDFATYLKYWIDPIEFIENNMAVSQNLPRKLYIHGYDLDATRSVYAQLDTSVWQLNGRLSDGLPLASVGWDNHFWFIDSDQNKAASWHFQVQTSGAYSLYAVIPRYYATAQKVHYQIWHSRTNIINPYIAQIDQSNNNEDKLAYLGTYDYLAGNNYSVDVFAKTIDSNVEQVAFDTLILVYEGDFGTGGGTLPPPPPPIQPPTLQTITSSGQLDLEYQGSHTPVLNCWGASVEKNNPILSGGLKEKTLSVTFSDLVYCNAQFEDGSWLADENGLASGQKLLADGTEITYYEDGQYGVHLVFYLQVTLSPPTFVCGNGVCESGETEENCPTDCAVTPLPPPPNNCGNGTCDNGEDSVSCPSDCAATPPPPPPPPPGNENTNGDGSGNSGGCQLMPISATTNDIMAYWLVIFSPLLLPLIRRFRHG